MKVILPPKFTDTQHDRLINYLKWVTSLSVGIITATVGVYKYLSITSEIDTFFYVLGWFCLIASTWMAFQGVSVLATMTITTSSHSRRRKFVKAAKKPSLKKYIGQLNSAFLTIKGVDTMVSTMFAFGVLSLAGAVLVPLAWNRLFVSIVALGIGCLLFSLAVYISINDQDKKHLEKNRLEAKIHK